MPNTRHRSASTEKFLPILYMLVTTIYLLDTFSQDRFVAIGRYSVCAAIFVFPLAYTCFDVIAEVYGYQRARQALWSALCAWILSAIYIATVIKTPFPQFNADYAKSFNDTMAPYTRSILVAVFAVLVGQFINIYVISKLKILVKGRYFWLRSVCSTLCGDVLTVTISLFGLFLGKEKVGDIAQLVVLEFIIAQIYHMVGGVPAMFLASYLKKAEGIDVYDTDTDFNPFKLSLDSETNTDVS